MPDETLANLCLVSRDFNEIFTQPLWYEPTRFILAKPYPFRTFYPRKFHTSADTSPVEYDKFARNVWKVRRQVRCLVIGLNFLPLGPVDFVARNIDSAALNSVRGGNLISEWFGSLGKCFPSLKFLFVNGMGHLNPIVQLSKEINAACLSTAVNANDRGDNMNHFLPGTVDGLPSVTATGSEREDSTMCESSYRPILLSAKGCGQLFIPMFIINRESASNLVFLDISWTKQKPRDLLILTIPPQLKVLKLQGLGLECKEMAPLLDELSYRLFSLDLSFNNLTDEIIPMLLANNFLPRLEQQPTTLSNILPSTNEGELLSFRSRYVDDAPVYREREDPTEEQETLMTARRVNHRRDNSHGVISQILSGERLSFLTGPHWFLPQESIFTQQTGLTHLYLSNNRLTARALGALLKSTNRLQLLDFGTARQNRQEIGGGGNKNIVVFAQPETVQLLKPSVSQQLESLRVHHSIVTTVPTLVTQGDFYLSEARAAYLSEFEYAEKNVAFWPPTKFLPEINPRIKSLTLTHVPRKSFGPVVRHLIYVLSSAAEQEVRIRRATPANQRRGAQMLPGLRLLVLEFAPEAKARSSSTSGPSISGDADADRFMAESMKDFSFFDERTQSPESAAEKDFSFFDGENRCEGTPWIPSEELSEKRDAENSRTLPMDVMDVLQYFRKQTSSAYEAERQRLGYYPIPTIPEWPFYHWTGELRFEFPSYDSEYELKMR